MKKVVDLKNNDNIFPNIESINEEDVKTLIEVFKPFYINKLNFMNTFKSNKLDDDITYSIKHFDYQNSHIINYIKLLIIQNDIYSRSNNLISTVFKINRNNQIINYAYIYGSIKKDNIENLFIVTSNSLISKDGEYKYRLIPMQKVLETFQLNNNKSNKRSILLLDKIYNYITTELKNKEFIFDYNIFNLINKKIKKKYIQKLSNKQLFIKIYIIVWICELYNIYINDQSINKNESYNNVVFSNKDINIFSDYYKEYRDEINILLQNYNYYNNNINLELGQKLIPFNYIQLKEYNNIKHFQWKELLINKIITNLLINCNSPCFSIFSNWFLIQNSNKNLYDNAEIYKKILYSDKIKNILKYLYLVKNNLIELKSFNERETIINILIQKVKKIITASESSILMSNVSLCYISEYSGKTFYDYLIKLSEGNEKEYIGNIYTDYNIFSKYLFEVIYSLYCLNLKGIIHGDLHLNNITFSSQNNTINRNNKSNKNHIIYDLNNQINDDILNYINNYSEELEINSNNHYIENCYIFPNKNTYPTIIDYSRSFLLINLIDENIIEKEKNKIRSNFIKSEQKRIINELNKIFPNYIKNNTHKIKFLFKNKNFNILFIYFTAYDIFTFSTNLLIFMKKISIKNKFNINDKIINLLTNISQKSYSYLENIIDENNYNNPNKVFQYPNYLILKEFFPEFVMTNKDFNKNINNIFNISNINIYTPFNKIKEILKSELIKYNNKNSIPDILKKNNNIFNKEQMNNELMVEKIINNEYYKIKGNLHALSTSLTNTSFNVTTNSLILSNY